MPKKSLVMLQCAFKLLFVKIAAEEGGRRWNKCYKFGVIPT